MSAEPTASADPEVTRQAPDQTRGPIEWTPTAGFPIDGVFFAIAVEPGDPQRLYAAVENLGFLHSRDGGLTWERNDVGHHFPRGILVDPIDEDTVYYAFGGGLALYDRAGDQQWFVDLEEGERPSAIRTDTGPAYSLENRVGAVVADATGGTTYISSPAGIFRTTDQGRHFERIGEGLPRSTIYPAIATHPTDRNVLYVGTRGPWLYDSLFPGEVPEGYGPRGLFRSADRGETWSQVGGPQLATLHINAVLVDEGRPSRVWIGTSEGVYRSDDDGATWARTSAGLWDVRVWTLAQDPSDPERLFAGTLGGGLFTSTTGGDTWQPTGLNALDFHRARIFSLAFDPNGTGRLYVGTGQGLFRYDVASGSFEHLAGTVFYSRAMDLTIAPDDPSRLYVLEGGAWAGRDLYRSTDGGASWKFIGPLQPLASTRTRPGCPVGRLDCAPYSIDHTYGMQVRIDPQDTSEVWYTSGFGLFVSRDGGDNWELVDTGVLDEQFHFHGIAIAPTDPQIMYVGTGGQYGDQFVFTHVIKSLDGGLTWHLADSGLPRSNYHIEFLIVDPRDADVVFIGTTDREFGCVSGPQPPCIPIGIYRTTDGGQTWGAVNQGLEDLNIYALAFDAADPDTLYAGAGSALYVSHDRGESWSKTWSWHDDGAWLTAVASAAEPHSLLVIGTSNGAYVSADGGETWSEASDGLSFRGQVPMIETGLVPLIDALVFAPDGTLYAAAGGVFRGTYQPED